MAALGDKIYKQPEYQSGFFHAGGLIVGSTNVAKNKSAGNPKAIDFYAGLKLDGGPLNPGRKTWKQAVEEERLHEEKSAVDSLKSWERTNLKEANPSYNPDENESDSDAEQ